ncbi:MAG TPA: NAD-dependent epimerase/dehydratase family protein [Planctomycetia bacterium]|nr:NAD-dependent epimerase/dehydratase family protein [Planctomycetia bacterium]
MSKKILVTGASGFVGGHIAERLIAEGHKVRTVVRPLSEIDLLKQWGVELVTGDLTDDHVVRRACADVDVVVHAAAKVGDWGPLADYRKLNVTGLQQMMDALPPDIERFILISSLGVYPARDHYDTNEMCPLPEKHIDGYTQSKAEADKLALKLARERKIPLTILRPGFVYGPRDRTILPRIMTNLKRGVVTYFGSAQKKLNQVYVGSIAEAVSLALAKPQSIGQTYNIRDPEGVTKEKFFGTVAELTGLPKPTRTVPMWLAKTLCVAGETSGKLFNFEPLLTGAKLKFMGLNLDYSIAKAQRELGFAPTKKFDEGIREAIDWVKAQESAKKP